MGYGTKGGSRGQSQVIGAVLIFGFIIAALGAAQVVLVPQANEEVEFNHNDRAQQDMQEVRNAIQRSAAVGASQSESVNLGPDYPTRFLLLNPGEGSGTIRTAGSTLLTIEGAEATDQEVRDFWTGDSGDSVDIPSKQLIYSPNYNYYDNAPDTVYENSVLYNRFEDSTDISKSAQGIVDGRRIYLTAVDGDLSTSQADSASVDVKSVTAATESITVERNAADEPIQITIPTELSEEVWVTDLLQDQIDVNALQGSDINDCDSLNEGGFDATTNPDTDDGRFVVDCEYMDGPDSNLLTLTFQEENQNSNPVTYSLKMAKIGVGTDISIPEAEYITDQKGDGADVALNGRQEVVFQVRNKYNNPVEDAEVDVEITEGPGRLLNQGDDIGQSDDNIPVGPDGTVELTYVAPGMAGSSPTDVNVSAKFDGGSFDSGGPKDANVSMEVINASRIDRTQPLFNPSDTVAVTGSEFRQTNCGGSSGNDGDCEVEIRLENLANSERTIQEIRYVFFSADTQGNADAGPTASFEIQNFQNSDTDIIVKENFTDISDVEFSDGEEKSLIVHMFEDSAQNNPDDLGPGDFIVISMIIDGERQTYIFAPGDGN